MKYLGHMLGFGMRPGRDTLSSYAVASFGMQPGLQTRTRLSYHLVKRDLMEMGRNNIPIDRADPMILRAFQLTNQAFQLDRRVNPYHLNDVFDLPLDMRSSSPGIPWQPTYRTRGEVMDCPRARNSIRWFWHDIKKGHPAHLPDTKVLYRAHIMNPKPKIRAVYGYPTTVTLAEAQFALPLIEAYRSENHALSYKYDMATGGAHRLWNELAPYNKFMCIDFSKFDKSVSADMIRIAFDILLNNLDLRRYRGHGVPDMSRLLIVWNTLVDYFINTNVRMCDGHRYRKSAGVPSGSYFTQLVDSVVNHFLITYAFLKQKNRPPQYLRVFGDDSVIGDSEGVPLCLLAHECYQLGMHVSLEKSFVTTDVNEVEYLGFCIRNGFPHRAKQKWLESLYHPEYADTSWDDFASRALGLFYANRGVDYEFDMMCRCVITHRHFEVTLTRNFRRFLMNVGVDQKDLSPHLPDRLELLFSLL